MHAPAIAWRAIGPTLALTGGAILTLLTGAIQRRVNRAVLAGMTLATIGGASYLTFILAGKKIVGLQGMVAVDGVSTFTTMILLFTATIVTLMSFHSWTPDVYQGAPTSVTGFMAAGTKAAGFAVLLRVFLVALGPLQWDWRPALWLIAIVTMVIGSLFAIVQSDVKRLLAYSSIAHAGFVLVGVIAATANGIAGSLFYLLVYAAMTLGAFAVVTLSAPKGKERLEMGSWVGLGQRHPVFAGAMTLFFLSLAGIPPTAGFMAKFFVFQAAVQAGETGLVIAGVLASVIAAFFYLRLIVLMWLQEPAGETGVLGLTPSGSLVVAITAAAA